MLVVAGTAAGSDETDAGSYSTQWTNVPDGASGSSIRSATARVAAGAPLHASGGEVLAPSQLNSAGIDAPSAKAVLVKVIEDATEAAVGCVAALALACAVTAAGVAVGDDEDDEHATPKTRVVLAAKRPGRGRSIPIRNITRNHLLR